MKPFFPILTAAMICGGSLSAAPLCDAFASSETMPKKYRKLAPILSGAPNDWIITKDQMDLEYAPNAEATDLINKIVNEFESRGTKLAIVMAPPRPLIAGQATLEKLSNGPIEFDENAVAASFNQMIDIVQSTGAIAPNLLELATKNDELREAYFYKHDTHWTPRGAAESAVELAKEVIASQISAFANSKVALPTLTTGNSFSERGSLAGMAHAVCAATVAAVVTDIPEFPQGELDLLDDTSSRPRILLAGSSFSNRYKKDAYRFASAISGALNAEVENHSVSGGGAIGAIEGIINAGLLDGSQKVDLVVWELPYTEGLRSIGMLRQLLGALSFDQSTRPKMAVDLDSSGKMKIDLSRQAVMQLALQLPDMSGQSFKVDLRFKGGRKQTLSLVRKKHVPTALQSDYWVASLDALSSSDLVSATLRYDPKEIGSGAIAKFY